MVDCGFGYRDISTGDVFTFAAKWEDQSGPLTRLADTVKPMKASKLEAKERRLTRIEASYNPEGEWEELHGVRLVNGELRDGGQPTGRRVKIVTWSCPLPKPPSMSDETGRQPATDRQIAYARDLLKRAYDKGVPQSEVNRMRAILDGAPTKAQASQIIGDISGDTIY